MADIFTFDSDDAERYADVISAVATAVAVGEMEKALTELAPIAGQLWMGSLKQTPRSDESEEKKRRREKDNALRAQVFVRDRFRCTHCGGRTVPRSILIALSDLFPAEIPYHPHYKRGVTHPVYWALAPEADHVFAHSRGGAFTLENLTTSHAACNTRKADSLASPPVTGLTDSWNGLLELYPALIAAGAGAQRPRYHREWSRLYARASVTKVAR